jgi:hypothetical protein
MTTETIDHGTLTRLVEAGAIRAAHVIGQAGGWALSVKYGMAERFLAAQRTGKLRLFRKLETVMAYLKALGISRFEVDASGYDAEQAKTHHKRPDRAEALKRAHEAAAHDVWFRDQVQQALDAADRPDAVFIPHEQVKASWAARRAELLRQTGGDNA